MHADAIGWGPSLTEPGATFPSCSPWAAPICPSGDGRSLRLVHRISLDPVFLVVWGSDKPNAAARRSGDRRSPNATPKYCAQRGVPTNGPCGLRCRVIPLPFGLDFSIASAPPLLSARAKVSGEAPLRGPSRTLVRFWETPERTTPQRNTI